MIAKKIFTCLALLLVFLTPEITRAHSVQIAYCVSCNGDLRIFVEHWHGTENPASTTMTITLSINGVPSTQTQPPVTGVQNVPVGSLPGCSTPITVAASCPGDANMYQDWVIYDYFGLPSGVPLSFTIVSGNTVFTQDGCGMYPLTVNFTIPPSITNGTPIDVCAGSPTPPINVPAGVNWTNSNPAIGLPASGTGPIPSFIPTGTGSATITYTNSCGINNITLNIISSITASFTDNTGGNGVCLGTPVAFTDNTGTGSGWHWDFGDGDTSNLQNPTHTYASPGNYNVTLTVGNGPDCPGVVTQPVVIHPPPVPSYTFVPACPGSNTTINNTTTIASGSATYQWTMPGGTPGSSTATNPVCSYPSGGTYTVNLVATSDQGCIDSLTQNVNIPYMPVPDFVFTGECLGTANSFTDMSTVQGGTITGWTWVWGDGTPVGTTQNPTHLYASSGTYSVTLIPTTNAGCTGPSITYDIDVYPQPVASFTVGNVCHGTPAQFNNTSVSGNTYQWTFGDGNTSALQNPSNTYVNPGPYTITLITFSGLSCSDTVTQNVTVYPNPVADFSFVNACLNAPMQFNDLSSVSSGTITGWNWDFGDGSGTSSAQNPPYLYGLAGTYPVTLIVTSNNGCMDTTSLPATPYAMPVPSFTSTPVCQGSSTQFTNTSTVSNGSMTYGWNFGDGNTSAQNSPSNAYSVFGNYTVTLVATTNNGCVDSITMPATVNPNPVISFTSDLPDGCSPLCVNFINNSSIAQGTIAQYAWSFSDGTSSGSATPFTCFTNTTQQVLPISVTLTATSDQGCATTLNSPNMLNVYPIPIANFAANPQPASIFDPIVTFEDQSVTSIAIWQWNFGDGGSSTDQHPVHEYAVPGTYDVNLFVQTIFGCTDDITIPVVINPEFILYVPNTFTPNGDGINDVFIPVIYEFGFDHKRYDFRIFNRWGEEIFYTQNYLVGWDGTYKAVLSKQDVYVWKIKVKDEVDGKVKEFYGHVNLLR